MSPFSSSATTTSTAVSCPSTNNEMEILRFQTMLQQELTTYAISTTKTLSSPNHPRRRSRRRRQRQHHHHHSRTAHNDVTNDHDDEIMYNRSNCRRRLNFEIEHDDIVTENEHDRDDVSTMCSRPRSVSSVSSSTSSSLLSSSSSSSSTHDHHHHDENQHQQGGCNSNTDDDDNEIQKISIHDRHRMIQWTYKIVDHFEFDRNVVAITWNYVDRYFHKRRKSNSRPCRGHSPATPSTTTISSSPGCSSSSSTNFQLIVVTCLYLAIKLHGFICDTSSVSSSSCSTKSTTTTTESTTTTDHITATSTHDGHFHGANTTNASISLEYLVTLTHGRFTLSQLQGMELRICTTLEWYLHPSTAKDLLHQAIAAASATETSAVSSSSSRTPYSSTQQGEEEQVEKNHPHSYYPKYEPPRETHTTPTSQSMRNATKSTIPTTTVSIVLEKNYLLEPVIYVTELALFQHALQHVKQSVLAHAALEIVYHDLVQQQKQQLGSLEVCQALEQVLHQFLKHNKNNNTSYEDHKDEEWNHVRMKVYELYATQVCSKSSLSTTTSSSSSEECTCSSSEDGRTTRKNDDDDMSNGTNSINHKKNRIGTPRHNKMFQTPYKGDTSKTKQDTARFSSPVCVISLK